MPSFKQFRKLVVFRMIKALSFSGAGFCGVYHLGATQALSKRLNFNDLQFAGASAGSIAAVSAAVWHGENMDQGCPDRTRNPYWYQSVLIAPESQYQRSGHP